MKDRRDNMPMLQSPARGPRAAGDGRSVEQVRLLYRRTLAGWVVDLLALRRSGRYDPSWQRADSRSTPGAGPGAGAGSEPDGSMSQAA